MLFVFIAKKELHENILFHDSPFFRSHIGADIVKYPYKVIHDELEMENCRFYDLKDSFLQKHYEVESK